MRAEGTRLHSIREEESREELRCCYCRLPVVARNLPYYPYDKVWVCMLSIFSHDTPFSPW